MTSYSGYLAETLLTLVAVSAVAFVVLYGARRMGIGRVSGPLALVGHLPIDPRRSVYLVRVASKVFVLGVAEGGMTKLGEFDAAEVPTSPAKSGDFASVFARALALGKPKAVAQAGEAE